MRIKLEGSPVPTIIRATLRSSSGHRRRGRSWSATRRAGTVSEYHRPTRERDAQK